MWFKNLLSLRVGTGLLKQFDFYHLPRMYQWAQTAAIQRVALATGLNIQPSDVILLSYISANRADSIFLAILFFVTKSPEIPFQPKADYTFTQMKVISQAHAKSHNLGLTVLIHADNQLHLFNR
jgi:hypothetical protein